MQSSRRSYTTVPPSIVTLVPIIEAIHRYKQDRMSIPFLFRKKRSAKFDDDDNDDVTDEDSDFGKSRIIKRSANKMYSSKFQYLLNEAPRFVNTQVDNEINKRFKNGSNEESKNEKSQESSNESSSGSSEYSKHPVKYRKSTKINSGEKPSVEAEVPEFDFSNDSVEFESGQKPVTKKAIIDDNKYPFYKDSSEFRDTAIKYITNPTIVPRKTFGGMEFYNSRNLECEDVNPNLDGVIPKDEDLANKRDHVKHQNRLHGLGDKLDCYKAKFFDEDPLDNPLFHEKKVDTPSPPPELDARQFASRISRFPGKKDEYVIPMGPKRPEQLDYIKRSRRPSRNQSPRYHPRPSGSRHYPDQQRPRKPAATELFTQRPKEDSSAERGSKKEGSNKKRQKSDKKKTRYKISPSYQRQVYEDVMGNIMHNEKLPKNAGAKRGPMHVHPKHGYRDKGNVHRDNRHEASRHHRTNNVKGPMPPKHIFDVINRKPVNTHYHKEKYVPRGTRHYYKVYKRSINSHKAQNNNTIHEKAKQNVAERSPYPFRIVITTEPPRTTSSNRSLTILSDESTTANPTFSIHDRLKHSRRPTKEDTKFNKFSAEDASSTDQRRNEPRYNTIQRRKMFSKPRNITLAGLINAELSDNVYQTTDASFRGSTLVPVVVRPDEKFTSRIPQESQIRFRKRRPHKSSFDDQVASKNDDDIDGSGSESNTKEKDDDDKENVDPVNLDLDPDFYEHKELSDFLQGEPPGYDKAFGSGESTNKDERKVRNKNERIDSGSQEAETKETDENSRETEKDASGEASGEDNSGEKSSEAPETDADSSKSAEKSKEPFERFSDRPYSPPENYEDDKYADLGPRINKPYFYHPPFEVPDYEKPGYEKDTDRADNFDNSQNEETEDHEKIAFPWEHDDEEDGEAGESKNFFKLGSFEYPWERREKKEREKRRRDKSRQKSDEESDEAEEATNKRFVWVPLKRDVGEMESSYGYNPRSKFSSKYRSEIDGSLEDDDEDDEEPSSIHRDDIKESILRDIKDMESSTPKVKISQKRFLNNTVSMSKTIDDLRNPMNMTEFKHLTSSTSAPSTTYQKSRRGTRAPQVTGKTPSVTNTNNAEKVKYIRRSFNGVSTTTPASTTIKRRGRITDSVSSATNTRQTNATNPVVRRRGRLNLITTTISPLTTTPRKVLDRRRRLFKINYNGTSTTPWTNDQNNTRTTSFPTSTERTVERHSRVSKQKIITETIEDDDDEEDDSRSNESSSRDDADGGQSSNKTNPTSERNRRTRNKDQEDRPKKEKVTITMEETPDHVFETKEIDRDGVKEKFVTITKNANSTGAQKSKNNFNMREEEKEELERKSDASKAFDRETGDTNSSNRPIQEAEKFVIGNLMKNLPVPAKKTEKSSENSESPEFDESEEEDDDEDYEDDESEEGEDEEENESEDEKDEESSKARSDEGRERDKNGNKTIELSPTSVAHPNKTLTEKLDTKKADNATEKSTSIVLISLVVFVAVASQLPISEAAPAPDSGGHIELPGPGIAFGGIPYGSVSGMLVNYGPAGQQQQAYYNPTSYGVFNQKNK
ncbi:unnamed protein product [Trichogramma brassicae]|uniref:Uncharacterized protein n=1 Tax=Trichogramma brassicae TaxID=86971 RepID=A0A6H5IHV2_9HYME|nr:unnamed protein product [Trichogramma brassicae]